MKNGFLEFRELRWLERCFRICDVRDVAGSIPESTRDFLSVLFTLYCKSSLSLLCVLVLNIDNLPMERDRKRKEKLTTLKSNNLFHDSNNIIT